LLQTPLGDGIGSGDDAAQPSRELSMSVFRSRPTRRHVLQHAGAAAAVLSRPGLVLAQEKFPSRPINLICPWPPGGSTDRHMRAVAELAGKHFGQNVIIQNQPGAGGTNSPGAMALNAKPDGYTIAQYPISMIRVAHMQKTQWHPINDFTFIIGITGYTFGFVVRSDSPYKTFEEYVEAARKAPGQISFGSTGIGTSPHLLLEQVSVPAKIQLNHIPFKGNADLMQALMGGHVMGASDATGWDRFVDSGQMRLLVTFGDKRTKRWPNVPTAKELGYDIIGNSPYGFVGPKNMDPAVVKALHDGFKKAMDEPKHQEMLDTLNQDPWYKTSDEYLAWAKATFAQDRALIERLGLLAK
jgi:tripartite-type tricarboxylate transporter receptor subunit TctC